MSEVIGETHLARERWRCLNERCEHEFELREAWFDPRHGVVCPKCHQPSIELRRERKQ